MDIGSKLGLFMKDGVCELLKFDKGVGVFRFLAIMLFSFDRRETRCFSFTFYSCFSAIYLERIKFMLNKS